MLDAKESISFYFSGFVITGTGNTKCLLQTKGAVAGTYYAGTYYPPAAAARNIVFPDSSPFPVAIRLFQYNQRCKQHH